MTSRMIRELHNDVDDLDFVDRRKQERRQSQGRRESDMEQSKQCAVHALELQLRDERCAERKRQSEQEWEQQRMINTTVGTKIDKIDSNLNYILGACFVLWPLVQLVIQHFTKK